MNQTIDGNAKVATRTIGTETDYRFELINLKL